MDTEIFPVTSLAKRLQADAVFVKKPSHGQEKDQNL
jgi:hypothetical protein